MKLINYFFMSLLTFGHSPESIAADKEQVSAETQSSDYSSKRKKEEIPRSDEFQPNDKDKRIIYSLVRIQGYKNLPDLITPPNSQEK